MKVEIDASDLRRMAKDIEGFSQRRLNSALATALTKTAFLAKADLRTTMTQVFDRPTPWTLKSIWVETATSNANAAGVINMPVAGDTYNTSSKATSSAYMSASVRIKDDLAGGGAATYMHPHIDAGKRLPKGLEVQLRAAGVLPAGYWAVPGQGAKLDRFGNMSNQQIIRVLSQLRITLLSGFTRNMSLGAARARAAQRKAGGRFFVMPIGSKVQPGIYQREFYGTNITPVLIFVSSVSYRRRLDFYGTVRRSAETHLGAQVERALNESLARMQASRGGAK